MERTKWVHDESEEGNKKAIEEMLAQTSTEDFEKWARDPKNRKTVEAMERLYTSKTGKVKRLI